SPLPWSKRRSIHHSSIEEALKFTIWLQMPSYLGQPRLSVNHGAGRPILRTDLSVWSISGKVGRSVRAFLRFARFMKGDLRCRRPMSYARDLIAWRVGLFSPAIAVGSR